MKDKKITWLDGPKVCSLFYGNFLLGCIAKDGKQWISSTAVGKSKPGQPFAVKKIAEEQIPKVFALYKKRLAVV